MTRSTFVGLLLLLSVTGCETTKLDERAPEGDDGEITITADEMEPMVTFLMETRRLLVADFVRIEASRQYFEQKMGFTRDLRFVTRDVQTLEDGTKVMSLKNTNVEQHTNLDPDLLPRVYFGNGLEIRAFNEIRVYFKRSRSRERPLYIVIQGKNVAGDATMYVSGRRQHEEPTLTIRSELVWSEDKERFLHRSAIG